MVLRGCFTFKNWPGKRVELVTSFMKLRFGYPMVGKISKRENETFYF